MAATVATTPATGLKWQKIVLTGDNQLEHALTLYGVDPDLIDFMTGTTTKEEVTIPAASEADEPTTQLRITKRLGMSDLEDFTRIAPVEKPGAVHDALASIRDRCEATADDIVQLSRLSACFEGIRSQLKANEDAVLKVEPPPADEDTEKPRTKAELKQLRTAWTARYSSSLWLDPQQTPCDSLVCRLYREFHGECMTLMLVNTVRTVLMDKKAPSKRHVPVGVAQDGLQVSVTLQADERNVTIGHRH